MAYDELKRFVKQIPILSPIARNIYARFSALGFTSSGNYWERRYRKGGTSGSGSDGRLAKFKAEFLNSFVVENKITSVVEFGCGDGLQLSLAKYPKYLGLDVSASAIEQCRRKFARDNTKTFALVGGTDPGVHDLALSLDVIFHLVEEGVFELYMDSLFKASRAFVIIYSSDSDEWAPEPHVKHRKFSRWIEANRPNWKLRETAPNPFPYDQSDSDRTSFANFYIYALSGRSAGIENAANA